MKYENHLNNETSPYLLQHVNNPVDWYPWCEEAFERATMEDKPIFLSIGYSTCHWCHVMAHESFENSKVARVLNDGFVSIKVDREERPDIDHVYMQACQLITGSGGWPMSIFMTPDQKPFFAGTYFPPDAFLRLLNMFSAQWRKARDGILESADRIEEVLRDQNDHPYSHAPGQNTSFDANELLQEALRYFRDTFDERNGGFGTAPKFPSPHNLMLLLSTTPQMAEKTLLQMYKGGIFDHVGGGFSRYSTDAEWLAPHFEKMLYDNAMLAFAYTLAYAKTQNPFYRHVADRTLVYLEQEMRAAEGGFYAAQDADTDGEEGKYYLFTPKDIEDALGPSDAKRFCDRYDITKAGNFEGKNIPNLLKAASDIDVKRSSDLSDDGALTDSLHTLYQYRKQRLSLHRDEKLLTGWNGLAAAAFAFSGRIFEEPRYVSGAKKTLDFMQKHLLADGVLFSGCTSGKTTGPAFLDDHAFYILALIQMYKATNGAAYLEQAADMTMKTIDAFWDDEACGFYFSGIRNEKLIAEVKETYDGAIPSGNSVMSYNMRQIIQLMDACKADDNNSSKELHAWGVVKPLKAISKQHQQFMDGQASKVPAGHSFYLFSRFPLKEITCQDGACSLTGEEVF